MTWAATRLALLAALAVSLAYLVQTPMPMPATGLLSTLTLDGFYPSEGGFRWSGGRAAVVFPDPGPGVPVRIELSLSGWRPRGQAPPRVRVSAGSAWLEAPLSRAVETVVLDARTAGLWRSDLVVRLDVETFRPTSGDLRPLGLRFHGARLVPLGPAVAPRLAPLRQVAAATLAVALAFMALARRGVPAPRAARAAAAGAVVLGLALAITRPWAAVASWPIAVLAGLAALLAWAAPATVRVLEEIVVETARALGRGRRVLATWPSAVILVAGAAAVTAAYRAHSSLDIDLGSGREAAVARGFGAYDAAGPATFRQPLPGAELDLRDFGGGRPWTISLTASVAGAPRTLVLAQAGGSQLEASLGEGWATPVFQAFSPWGWRSGLALTFPAAAQPLPLRIDRVRVERAGSLPSLRVVTAVVAAALLAALALAAAGLTAAPAFAGATVLVAGQAVALWAEPVSAIPFAPAFAAICAVGVLVASFLHGAQRLRPASHALPPAALAAAASGFVAWLAVAAFPLYRGGHFGFHSSIAEEIWKGRFLLYYLPYPGSMLSRQEQWGNLIVPHPCLYHTVISPLAALPRPWFLLLEKAFLALLLSSLVLVCAALAQRLHGRRAAAYAAVAFATLAPTFQLLGLGHLMTLFGVWAATVALAFVLARFDHLRQPTTWCVATALLALCFLSYTASLLFTALVLCAAVALLWRSAPGPARALAAAGAAAAALAFGLYYVNWAWPFLRESLPRILTVSGASGEAGSALWKRLALQPQKLAYTFGSIAVPLTGLAGLILGRGAARHERVILGCWAAILLAFCGLDLVFNFLRKHHYFVMAPLAAGAGVALARLAERGRVGRLTAAALCLAGAALGLRTALDAALGRIP